MLINESFLARLQEEQKYIEIEISILKLNIEEKEKIIYDLKCKLEKLYALITYIKKIYQVGTDAK